MSFFNSGSSHRMRDKPTLEGDLKNLHMPNVVQSIAMSKATGRLELENAHDLATIFFADGAPIHCQSRGLQGEASFIELVSWEDGEFRFYPGPRHDKQTIKRRLETLLMEGSAVNDQLQSLRKLGAKENAFLSRTHESISEDDFESLLKTKGKGSSAAELTKRMYLRIDGRTRLIDLVHRFNLPKRQWVPIIFDLVTSKLVQFNDQVASTSAKLLDEPEIDWAQAVGIDLLMAREETGICSYPGFLFLLRGEFARWERFGRPFSVVLLELSYTSADAGGKSTITSVKSTVTSGKSAASSPMPKPLPLLASEELSARVAQIKRKTDIFAHFEPFGFALLAPETDGPAGKAFAGRLVDGICSTPFNVSLEGASVQVKAGVACIPSDCSSLEAMLSLAKPLS